MGHSTLRKKPKAKGLFLVGVVHRDPEGYVRLADLLQAYGPDAVSVEISPLGLVWRESRSASLLARLDLLLKEFPAELSNHYQVRLIRAALEMPFEYTAARDYVTTRGVFLYAVDLNWISRGQLPLYDSEVVTRGNLAALLKGEDRPLEEIVAWGYRRAAQGVKGRIPLDRWDDASARRREHFLACRLRRFVARHRCVVHVGGWAHLVEDRRGRSLAGLLRDLAPRRILLGGDEGPPLKSLPSA